MVLFEKDPFRLWNQISQTFPGLDSNEPDPVQPDETIFANMCPKISMPQELKASRSNAVSRVRICHMMREHLQTSTQTRLNYTPIHCVLLHFSGSLTVPQGTGDYKIKTSLEHRQMSMKSRARGSTRKLHANWRIIIFLLIFFMTFWAPWIEKVLNRTRNKISWNLTMLDINPEILWNSVKFANLMDLGCSKRVSFPGQMATHPKL